jgi:hypothetical protein
LDGHRFDKKFIERKEKLKRRHEPTEVDCETKKLPGSKKVKKENKKENLEAGRQDMPPSSKSSAQKSRLNKPRK